MKDNVHITVDRSRTMLNLANDLIDTLSAHFHVTSTIMQTFAEERGILLCCGLDLEVVRSDDFAKFTKRILVMPISGTLIKNSATKQINKFDLIIANSMPGMKVLVRNGVFKPIKVVPGYFKPSILDNNPEPKLESVIGQEIGNRSVIYHESPGTLKENLRLLYKSYVKAFSDTNLVDKVVLLVKDQPYHQETFDSHELLKEEVFDLQSTFKNPAKIVHLAADLKDSEINYLMKRAAVVVNTSGIENFCDVLLKALILDKPIVALRGKNSGYMDYLNDYNSYLVNSRLEKASGEHQWLYSKGSKWVSVESNIFAAILRQTIDDVFAGKAKLLSKNKRESKRVFAKFLSTNVLDEYVTILKTINQKDLNGNQPDKISRGEA